VTDRRQTDRQSDRTMEKCVATGGIASAARAASSKDHLQRPKSSGNRRRVTVNMRFWKNGKSHEIGWLVEQGLTAHSTQFRSFRRRCFYSSDDPTNSVKALKEGG